jgi:hypothetical protein
MAQFADFYLPSVGQADNIQWRFSYYKPQGRPGVVCCTEGELERLDGATIFRHTMFQARRHRRELPGRATKRAISQALAELLRAMVAEGVIPADRADNYIRQAEAV